MKDVSRKRLTKKRLTKVQDAILTEWYGKVALDTFEWNSLCQSEDENDKKIVDFWRTTTANGVTRKPRTDQEMFKDGDLIATDNFGIQHIAYIPLVYMDGSPGKINWTTAEWLKFDRQVQAAINTFPREISQIDWSSLTLSSGVGLSFLGGRSSLNLLFGNVNLSGINLAENKDLFVFGDLEVNGGEISNIRSTGSLEVMVSTILNGVKVEKFVAKKRTESHKFDITIIDCEIKKVIFSSNTNDISIKKSEIGKIVAKGKYIDSFSISSDFSFLGILFERCRFSGLFIIDLVAGRASYPDSQLVLTDTIFDGRVRLRNAPLQLSNFATTRFNATLEIQQEQHAIEDIFEEELAKVEKAGVSGDEGGRANLEFATQALAESYRRDGRKDMEYRFRRLELKARSRRANAPVATKFLNANYEFFSDFGQSFTRPIRGLALIWIIFFCVYWAAAAIDVGASFCPCGSFDSTLIRDAAMLAIDKSFPFGASVDESELFAGQLIGVDGGKSAIFVGLSGSIQTILSTLMFFLVGLAIRTRLLIG